MCCPMTIRWPITPSTAYVAGRWVHAENNECMQTWVETGIGAFCLRDFAEEAQEVMPERFALP